MSICIHALFDRPAAAAKAAGELEVAGIATKAITIVGGGDGAAQEANHILDQHGMSSEIAAAYAHALGEGGALLWLHIDPALQRGANFAALLERSGALLVDTATLNDDAGEPGEAEGWDDFNDHGNEHSPDPGAESMWTSRDGRTR